MRLPAGDHVVGRAILLQHCPHRDNVVLGMTPVTPCLQISESQTLCQSQLDARNMRRDFPADEFVPAARTLMIEEYSAGGMKVVCLPVIPRQMITGNLRNTVGGTRVKLRLFVLRRDGRLTEHLTRAGEIEAGMRANFADTREHVMRAVDIRIDRRELIFEGITDEALSGQVIHLVRLNVHQNFVEARITFQRCRMQTEFIQDSSNAPKPVLRIFQRDAPDDAVDFITLLEKELGQIGSVLTGESRNGSLSCQTTSGR